ncbi:MAG: hypothetical protein B6229_02140 [Spirochaetaceae bacterium 4572_7]|nr:MAG: hypothetical protein B6229_02140 [Spirochaetaceae bacterium 4572_7]
MPIKDGNKLTDNQISIIKLISKNPKISAQKLSVEISINKRNIEENLAKLKDMGVIKRIGKTRGYWEIESE